MNSAEPKTKSKRIRHCYPRQEVYHRFIHDSEYYYSNKAHAISSKGNYLALGDIGKNKSVSDIEEYWYPGNNIFAVIDRENKKILVSHKYSDVAYELLNAIPDDYEVFHCKNNIPFYNILHYDNIDALAKLHLQYSVECYVEHYLTPFYAVCNGKKILHNSLDGIIKDINNRSKDKLSSVAFNKYAKYWSYEYGNINEFVKKYKVKRRTWYNEVLNDNFTFYIYYPDSWGYITIKLPTVKQILTNTVFTKTQQEVFRKRYFYTKYCYGRGISFADVEKYWTKEMLSQEMNVYFNKHNIYWLSEYYTEQCITWNDYVIRSYEIDKNHHKKYIQENIAKSNQNRKEAEEKAKAYINQKVILDDWRKGNHIKNGNISFRKFCPPKSRNQKGFWKDSYICTNNIGFQNTQLKLVNNEIITSRHARVPIENGIKIFKLLLKCIANNKQTGETRFTFGHESIKVGIYNFRSISYCTKQTDDGRTLDYKTWLVKIGCHNLWLDDIEDFIKYYHLEDKFYPNNNNTQKNN